MDLGPYTQNLFSQNRKIFVTLFLNILRFLSLKCCMKQISLKVDNTDNINNKMAILYVLKIYCLYIHTCTNKQIPILT
jgi:hypothetical protein